MMLDFIESHPDLVSKTTMDLRPVLVQTKPSFKWNEDIGEP